MSSDIMMSSIVLNCHPEEKLPLFCRGNLAEAPLLISLKRNETTLYKLSIGQLAYICLRLTESCGNISRKHGGRFVCRKQKALSWLSFKRANYGENFARRSATCSLLCLLYETAHIARVVQHVSAHGQRGLFAKCRQANKGGTASNFALWQVSM